MERAGRGFGAPTGPTSCCGLLFHPPTLRNVARTPHFGTCSLLTRTEQVLPEARRARTLQVPKSAIPLTQQPKSKRTLCGGGAAPSQTSASPLSKSN